MELGLLDALTGSRGKSFGVAPSMWGGMEEGNGFADYFGGGASTGWDPFSGYGGSADQPWGMPSIGNQYRGGGGSGSDWLGGLMPLILNLLMGEDGGNTILNNTVGEDASSFNAIGDGGEDEEYAEGPSRRRKRFVEEETPIKRGRVKATAEAEATAGLTEEEPEEEPAGNATVEATTTSSGGTWGDPWYKDPTNPDPDPFAKDWGHKGVAGNIYNLLSDKHISINSKYVPGDPTIGTINGTLATKIMDDKGAEHRFTFDALTGKAQQYVKENNQWVAKDMAVGQTVTLDVNGEKATVQYLAGQDPKNPQFGSQFNITTNEYAVNLNQTKDQNHDKQVFQVRGNVGKDKVTPNGLIGGAIDGDTNVRKGDHHTAKGAVDFDDGNAYQVKDLFADSDNEALSRYGAKVITETDQANNVTRIFKRTKNGKKLLIATQDKAGKLVSVRRRKDDQGKVSLTLADGTTKVDDSGKILA